MSNVKNTSNVPKTPAGRTRSKTLAMAESPSQGTRGKKPNKNPTVKNAMRANVMSSTKTLPKPLTPFEMRMRDLQEDYSSEITPSKTTKKQQAVVLGKKYSEYLDNLARRLETTNATVRRVSEALEREDVQMSDLGQELSIDENDLPHQQLRNELFPEESEEQDAQGLEIQQDQPMLPEVGQEPQSESVEDGGMLYQEGNQQAIGQGPDYEAGVGAIEEQIQEPEIPQNQQGSVSATESREDEDMVYEELPIGQVDIIDAESQIEDLRKDLIIALRERDEAERLYHNASQESKTQKSEIIKLKADLEGKTAIAKSRARKTQDKLTNILGELHHTKTLLTKANERIQEESAKVIAAEEQIESLGQELLEAKDNRAQIQEELDEAKKVLEGHKETLDKLGNQLAEVVANLKNSQIENARLKRDLIHAKVEGHYEGWARGHKRGREEATAEAAQQQVKRRKIVGGFGGFAAGLLTGGTVVASIAQEVLRNTFPVATPIVHQIMGWTPVGTAVASGLVLGYAGYRFSGETAPPPRIDSYFVSNLTDK